MRKKLSKLNHLQLNPSKKGSLLMVKKKKNKGVWYLALVAFFITIWVIGYFSR